MNNNNSHSCSCGCCGEHSSCKDTSSNADISLLSQQEKDFIHALKESHYFPISRFILKSNKESDFVSVALPCVYIYDLHQTMEQVKEMSALITGLEHKGLISVDYDIPLKNYTYDEYFNSDIYAYFKNTVEQAKDNENFLGNIADIECGSIAPTDN